MSVEYQPRRRDLWRLVVGLGVAATGISLFEQASDKEASGNRDYNRGLGEIGTNDHHARRDLRRAKDELKERDIFGGTAIADEVAAVAVIAQWVVRKKWRNSSGVEKGKQTESKS